MNILFTSVGRRSYLVRYFREALGNRGEIHVANSSRLSPAFQFADHCVVTPLIYDEHYIPFLLDYCSAHQITAIISLFDVDLPVLARSRAQFAEIGVRVIVSDERIIDICNDKWKTYQYLKENGFHVPQTHLYLKDAVCAIEEGRLSFPLMVKPRWGMGSIAIYEADDLEELKLFYKKAVNTIQKTYLKYESAGNLEHCVLIQEKIQGQEYGLDIINDLDANYQTTICKKKYAMRSGETDCSVTVDDAALKELGERLGKKLGHIANMDCDVFWNGDTPYILELNARFGGGYPFSHAAGVNLPKAIIGWMLGETVPADWLKETIGVMTQKDIVLVRLDAE